MSGPGQRRKGVRRKDPGSKRLKLSLSKTIDLGWNEGNNDEEIDSDDEGLDDQVGDDESSDGNEEETADARRVRLARHYLEKIEKERDSSDDDDDEREGPSPANKDRVSLQLQKERMKREGTLEVEAADHVGKYVGKFSQEILERLNQQEQPSKVGMGEEASESWIEAGRMKLLRGHNLTTTCVALQEDGMRAISGSKDNSVLLWDIENSKKISSICNQWKRGDNVSDRNGGEALAVATSGDGRYAVIGRRDATVAVYDIRLSRQKEAPKPVASFKGHKGPVTCLAFRHQSYQLFSGSEDRCIRHYSLDEMSYLETLYGHQAGVTGIGCHRNERPISVGRDRTARAWKLAEDTHLIFRGGSRVSSPDCVVTIKDDWFVSGHEDGNLGLWFTEKKKAAAMIEKAHGTVGSVGRGICSVDALKFGDLAVTGSCDGYLRLWKVSTGATLDNRGLQAVSKVPLLGFINGVALGPNAKFCVVAVGQEPRLGRWERIPRAKNRIGLITLSEEASSAE